MSIEVKNLTRNFGSQKAVNDISFKIGKKEIVGFIGPNGAGKSTTMKILTGILPPSSGKAFIKDIDVSEDSLLIKQLIGYLPESNPLYTEMYVREYLEYVLGLYKKFSSKEEDFNVTSTERIDKVIELTGLGPEQHKKIQALSKGFKQRVGLAQAIIHDPEILILDEPTSGLDPAQIIEIRNLILDLGKEKTVLLSTHLMQEVQAICNRVIMINKGKIVADGSPEEISAPGIKDKETILLEIKEKVHTDSFQKIENIGRIVELENNQFLIESEAGNDLRSALFNFAVENGLTILSLQKKQKNLEEVFQELSK